MDYVRKWRESCQFSCVSCLGIGLLRNHQYFLRKQIFRLSDIDCKDVSLQFKYRRLLTLYFYNNEPSKNNLFLILPSILARNSQEPKVKWIFEILWVLFEKIFVFYSDLPKSWIWWTLGHVRNISCKCHLHNASKKVFWPKKSF